MAAEPEKPCFEKNEENLGRNSACAWRHLNQVVLGSRNSARGIVLHPSHVVVVGSWFEIVVTDLAF